MKALKKYLVYMDDGKDVFRLAIPAENKKAAADYVKGNGEIVKITDVTDRYPISLEYVYKALTSAGFGETETDLITRTLLQAEIAE
jgi:hypothetical protein